MLYYILTDGQQNGPMEIEKLCEAGLSAESMVWREGLAEWVRAGELPELAEYIVVVEPVAEAKAEAAVPPTPPEPEDKVKTAGLFDNSNLGPEKRPFNWMALAIIGGTLGWLGYVAWIPGVVGLVFAIIAQGKWRSGAYEGASKFNRTAMILTVISLGLTAMAMMVWPFIIMAAM